MATPTLAVTTLDALQQDFNTLAAREPQQEDAAPWLTRYVFNPFRNRPVSPYYQSLYGLSQPSLRAGMILRFGKHQHKEVDHDAVSRVGMDEYGQYVMTGYGNDAILEQERRPMDTVAGVLRSHNPATHTENAENNGILELTAMRGLDDRSVHIALQMHFLPEFYKTAREQVVAIQRGLDTAGSKPSIFTAVGNQLLEFTQIAIADANVKYVRLKRDMQEYGRTGVSGKKEPSPRDYHLCQWLEVEVPELQSILATQAKSQTVQAGMEPAIEFMLCPDCGNRINKVDGNVPRLGCLPCGWNPHKQVAAQEVIAVTDESEPAFNANNPMGETESERKEKLRQKQLEAQERNRRR